MNIVGPGLDRSYPHVLNLFAFTSMRFGTDLIYTYGPLGFLLHVENVRNNLAIGFVFWFSLYLFFSISLTHFILRLTSSSAQLIGLALALIVASFVDTERLLPCLVMVLLLLAFEDLRHKVAVLALCGALTSVALMAKFPIGITCFGMTVGSAVWPLRFPIALKQLLVVLLSVVVFFTSFWFASCGSFEGIPAYFVNSLQLTSGYTSVMSLARPNENVSLSYFIVAIILIISMIFFLPKSRRNHLFLVLLFPLFVSWKSGTVRFDGHVLALVNMATFIGLLLCVMSLNREASHTCTAGIPGSHRQRPRSRQVIILALFFIACVAMNEGLAKMRFTRVVHPLISRDYTEGIGGVKDSWIPGLIPLIDSLHFEQYKKSLDNDADANLAESRFSKELLNIIGQKSVDIYSYELGFLAANPTINYHPKPVFQHFNAFTERLDQLNERFFASSGAPEFLIMYHPNNGFVVGVDGRHPLYDDPIAFLRIMNSYKPIFVEDRLGRPQVALLQHQEEGASARFGDPISFKEEIVKWNETVDLPTTGRSSVLRLKVDLQKGVLSTIQEAVFRLSPMYLTYLLSDGTSRRFRLVPSHMKSGVWVSPLFEDYWALYAFLRGKPWLGPKVVAVRFEADDSLAFPESFKIIWERIECLSESCDSTESRIFNSSTRRFRSFPIPITSTLVAKVDAPAPTIAAIDVRLSTYAKTNEGILTLQIVDAEGRILRESHVDAATTRDNQYRLFTFNPLEDVEGASLELRLMYQPTNDGTIAAWRASASVADFDFRVYGH